MMRRGCTTRYQKTNKTPLRENNKRNSSLIRLSVSLYAQGVLTLETLSNYF